MPRYFIQLSYNGSRYHGWQSQDNAHSVQEAVEAVLSERLNQPITVTGAGRTDTGVHASNYFAHFDAFEPLPLEQVSDDLARMMPRDISVMGVFAVSEDAHARFSAQSRQYHYVVSRSKDVFMGQLAYHYRPELNLHAIRMAGIKLVGTRDFAAFEKLGSDNSNSICTVFDFGLFEVDDFLIFSVKANRFLRNMVRAIVGTLIDVGRGKLEVAGFEDLMISLDRSAAGTSAPAHGLYLTGIEYPSGIFLEQIPQFTILPSFLTGKI